MLKVQNSIFRGAAGVAVANPSAINAASKVVIFIDGMGAGAVVGME
ncbi:MAG: hypothetical protein V4724_02230 [Pseudomonadota bacterium]